MGVREIFDSKQVNVFALSGGKAGVYTGLLQLAENDSELAVVMGQEIGHVIALESLLPQVVPLYDANREKFQ